MSVELVPTNVDEFLVDPSQVDLKKRLQNIIASTQAMEVTTDDHFKQLTNLYSESKEWEKRIEFIRKQANGPDQDRINARNDKAKEFLDPLRQIQNLTKRKCSEYQTLLEERRKEEEKRVQDAVDLLGLDETPYLAPVDKSTRGDGAIMYTRTVRKFRIVDFNKVPSKYLQVNDDLVERDIKLGVGEIPGIEIYEEKETKLRTR